MNTNYLTILLWVATLILSFIGHLLLIARQRGRDERKIEEMDEFKREVKQELEEHDRRIDALRIDHDIKIGALNTTLISFGLRLENIVTYLESKNGITFRRN